MSVIETFLPTAARKTAEWLQQMRDRHSATARPLNAEELTALGAHFDATLLDSVRVKTVTEIEKPPFYDGLRSQLAFVGVRVAFDFAAVRGITFDNCILVRESPLSVALLFHELVHVEQYRQLGIPRFAAAYVRGLAENRFEYEENPIEKIAVSLKERFNQGDHFSAGDEIKAWLATREY